MSAAMKSVERLGKRSVGRKAAAEAADKIFDELEHLTVEDRERQGAACCNYLSLSHSPIEIFKYNVTWGSNGGSIVAAPNSESRTGLLVNFPFETPSKRLRPLRVT